MKCGEVTEKLQAYIGQELNLCEIRIISQHLESCKGCAEKRRLSELISELIGETKRVELSSDFTQEVMRQEENQAWLMEEIEKTSEVARKDFILTTLASCLVLTVAGMVGMVGITTFNAADYFLFHAISSFFIISLLKNLITFDADYFLSPPRRKTSMVGLINWLKWTR